jgi:RecA-family ATPase
MFALSLARSLTEGTDLLGRMAFQTPVLYLGLDVSLITLQSYIAAMRWSPNRCFRFMTMWTGEDKQPPMLDDSKQMEKLYAMVREMRGLVIIFDTLRDFFEGEENSSTDTKPVLDAVRKLRALGATVILLVHPPKSGNSIIRGTGNISQKVDIPYLMERQQWKGKDIVVLCCPKKNRFGSTHFRLPISSYRPPRVCVLLLRKSRNGNVSIN